jgi:hypothetical protein
MSSAWSFPILADRPFDAEVLVAALVALADRLRIDRDRRLMTRLSIAELGEVLGGLAGADAARSVGRV